MVDIVCRRFRLGLASGIRAKLKEQVHINTEKQEHKQAPVQQTPVQQIPVQQTPVQQAPAQQIPVQQAPTVRRAKNNKPAPDSKTDGAAATSTVAELLKKKKDRDI